MTVMMVGVNSRDDFPLKMGNVYSIMIQNLSPFDESSLAGVDRYVVHNDITGVKEGEFFSLAKAMLQVRANEYAIGRLFLPDISEEELEYMETTFGVIDDGIKH
jgi:hypothetical protein